MTITRADVEACMAEAEAAGEEFVMELCHLWLTVADATTSQLINGATSALFLGPPTYIPAGTYKLVCIDTPKD